MLLLPHMDTDDTDETPSTFKAIGVAMKEIVSGLGQHHQENQHGTGTNDGAGNRCQNHPEDDHRAAVVAKDGLVKIDFTRLHGDAPVIDLNEVRRFSCTGRAAGQLGRAGRLRVQARY